jgi:hypothetical protein
MMAGEPRAIAPGDRIRWGSRIGRVISLREGWATFASNNGISWRVPASELTALSPEDEPGGRAE